MNKKFNVFGRDFLIDEILIFVLGLIGIVATFLPYCSVTLGNLSRSDSLMTNTFDGFMFIGLYLITMFFAYSHNNKVGIISNVALIGLMLIVHFGINDNPLFKYSIGFYVTLISIIGMIICNVMVYNRYKNNSDVSKIFDTVAEKADKFTKVADKALKNVDLSSLKSTVKCSKCGKEYSKNMNFCPDCGTPKPKEPEIKKCEKCGSKLANGAKFCPSCGEKVITEKPEKKCVCKNCGLELSEGTVFCGSCGSRVGD